MCLALLLAWTAPISAAASDREEFPDVSGGNSVGLFKVAEVVIDNGFRFVVDPRFASVGELPATSEELDRANVELAAEMAKIAENLDFDIPPVEMDSGGTVKFTNLEVGLYLVMQAKRGTDDHQYVIAPFLISIPNKNPDGKWLYDVNAQSKPIGIAWIPPESPDEPSKPKKLPQTGQLWWPVMALGAAGMAFIIAGTAMKRR